MITFYPDNNGMWGDDFAFDNDITLTPKSKTDHKTFDTRAATASYIREAYGNTSAVVEFFDVRSEARGPGLNVIINGVCCGWAKDDYK